MLVRGAVDDSGAGLPQPGDGAEERAFPRAALAHDEQAAAPWELEAEVLRECFAAAGSLHGYVVELELECFFVDFALRFCGLAGVFRVELIEVIPQVAEPPDACGERAEPFDLRDDDRERRKHCGERAFCLRDDAKLDGAAHEHRPDDEAGDDEREVVVAICEKAEIARPADDPEGVFQRVVQPLDKVAMLTLFSTKEGDGLRVVAHSDEAVTERRLLLILVKIQPYEPPPEEHGDDGADGGVEK